MSRCVCATAAAVFASMLQLRVAFLLLVVATVVTTRAAHAQCEHLTRPVAARLAPALQRDAPAWARPLLTAAQLVRFEGASYHALTYFLGYGALTVERIGTGGVPPYTATAIVRCRGLAASRVDDPLAWANARAHELHVTLTSAEMAAGYAAEVMTLYTGHRPDGASGRRRGDVFNITVTYPPRQGETVPTQTLLEVGRDGSIQRIGASSAPP